MKTDELVAMLAKGARPVPVRLVQKRFLLALSSGLLASALLMLLTMGVRPDVSSAATLPMFWVKLLFPLLAAAATLHLVSRLARPGANSGRSPVLLLLLLATLWLMALASLFSAAPEDRAALILGDTWLFCLFAIPALSIPVFIAAIWVLKGMAPTRLVLAGGAAGLLAGSAGAAVYALHCPELAAPFLAVWYVLGILIPAAIGALLGPRLLRW